MRLGDPLLSNHQYFKVNPPTTQVSSTHRSSSSNLSLDTLPIPPAPYHYTVPNSHIGITLTDYGADIPVRQGFGLMTTWLDQWNEITHEGEPALEALTLQRNYVWNNGPVRITLRPKLLPIPDMRWLDVYGLILLLIQFLRRYVGMVEAEMEIVGIFPEGRRPNILLGHATLELVDRVRWQTCWPQQSGRQVAMFLKMFDSSPSWWLFAVFSSTHPVLLPSL